MDIVFSLTIGYLLGTLSPAALLAKWKEVDLRREGTGNLGATNTMMVMGKRYGALAMLLDIAKAFLAYKLAAWIFSELNVAGLLAGAAAMVGHIFPFYMKFKGGKGFATFGGMILAYDVRIFLFLLITGVILMIIVNYTVALHMYVALMLPILAAIVSGSTAEVLICTAASALFAAINWHIIGRARRGEDKKVRDFLRGK